MRKEGLQIAIQIQEGVRIERSDTAETHILRLKRVSATAKTGIVLTVTSGTHTIIEVLEDAVEGGNWDHHVQVIVGEGANVEYVSQQTAGGNAHMTLSHRSTVANGGSVRWLMATLGGVEVEHTLQSTQEGSNALSDINWLFFAHGKEKQRLSARNIFAGRDGRGEITMKGVAEGHAHTHCDGMIEIGLKGGGTDTYLTQEVLMLDTTAKVDAIPGLEIRTNDVKASHSATVSRVTDEDLFYFAARGIEERDAKKMFVMGFLRELTEKMQDQTMREALVGALEAKYERASVVEIR